jgi:metal transporter CNNM
MKSKLMITRFGAMDLKGMLMSAKKRDYLMTVIEVVERGIMDARKNPNQFKRSPDSIFQMSVIFDMAGFSMRHITYKPGIPVFLCL